MTYDANAVTNANNGVTAKEEMERMAVGTTTSRDDNGDAVDNIPLRQWSKRLRLLLAVLWTILSIVMFVATLTGVVDVESWERYRPYLESLAKTVLLNSSTTNV